MIWVVFAISFILAILHFRYGSKAFAALYFAIAIGGPISLAMT